MDRLKIAALALSLCTLPTKGAAEYLVDGDIEASVCSGFIIKKCTHKKLVAFSNGDGNKYDMPTVFKSVSEMRNGRCWINISSEKLTSQIINSVTGPSFYIKNESELSKVSPDYLVFNCNQR